jgi:hypothetical protein
VARKKAEYKTGNNSSGANLGLEQKIRTVDKMRLYTDPVEHKYVVLGLDLKELGYEA